MVDRDRILVVDDIEVNRIILRKIFEGKFQILEAENGKEALDSVEAHAESIAVILLDITMPVMNGFEVMKELGKRGYLKFIPVILITGDDSEAAEEEGLDLGVSDIIRKPINPKIVIKRAGNVIDLYQHKNHLEELVEKQTKVIEEQANQLRETNDQIIDTLSSVVEFRSLESGTHIKRIKWYTGILLKYAAMNKSYRLNEEVIERITRASAMHDIGKIAIPDSVLLKPGRLDKEEFEVMKQHTVKGCEILETINAITDKEFYRCCYDICRGHHERWDGRGYPDGLKEMNIPLSAQIVSIADVYDALTSERVYKAAYSHEKAIDMIMHGECGTFSPDLIDCLKMAKQEFQTMVTT